MKKERFLEITGLELYEEGVESQGSPIGLEFWFEVDGVGVGLETHQFKYYSDLEDTFNSLQEEAKKIILEGYKYQIDLSDKQLKELPVWLVTDYTFEEVFPYWEAEWDEDWTWEEETRRQLNKIIEWLEEELDKVGIVDTIDNLSREDRLDLLEEAE